LSLCNKRVGWLDDHHGPSPFLCDTVAFFVHIDQFSESCETISYNHDILCMTNSCAEKRKAG